MSCLMRIESCTSKVCSTALMTTTRPNRCRYNNFITIILIFNIIASPLSSTSSSLSSRLSSTVHHPPSRKAAYHQSIYGIKMMASQAVSSSRRVSLTDSYLIQCYRMTYRTVMMSIIALLFITPCNHYTLSSATILLLPLPLPSSYSF